MAEVDRAAWHAARQPGDRLCPGGAAAAITITSAKKREKGYGRWLTWLELRGELDPHAPPGERATQPRVIAYTDELITINAPYTVLLPCAERSTTATDC